MELNSVKIKDNINVHYLKTDKFKTNLMSLFIRKPLKKEEVTINSLLSAVLKRSSEKYPTTRELSRKLDELYGASYVTGVTKKGSEHIISAYFSYVNDKFLPKGENNEDEIFEIAYDVLFGRKSFSEDYVNQEKENLKNLIEAQKNDKKVYASVRLLEEMCKDELLSVNKIGYKEDVDKITSESLYEYYRESFLKSPVDIFVCGLIDEDKLTEKIKAFTKNLNPAPIEKEKIIFRDSVQKVNNVKDKERIVQGKLSMGFRFPVSASDDDYFAAIVFNGTFGGGVSSKLFNNVREKMSLCYYASSSIDFSSGVMVVNSGIECKNFEITRDSILKELNDIKNGVLTDEETNAAKLGIINSYQSATDSPLAMQSYYLSGFINGKEITIAEMIENIKKVTTKDVIKVANKAVLDTVYFMTNSEEE